MPLRRALHAALAQSFNALTVDGDTSTNDTVIALANGLAGHAPLRPGSGEHRRFTAALSELLDELGRLILLDGEGATRCVEVVVSGARSVADARRVARAIAGSLLVKAAFHGGDPNWGRILCAAGYAGAALDPERCRVSIGRVPVARGGRGCGNETAAARVMRDSEFRVTVDLGSAKTVARTILRWEAAYGSSYRIDVSTNGTTRTTVWSTTTGNGGTDNDVFTATTARYVRMTGLKRATSYGYSLWEFEVYGR